MEFQYFSQKVCCGKTVETFKCKSAITQPMAEKIAAKIPGATLSVEYVKYGLINIESPHIMINGSFGANMFQVKNIGKAQGYADTLELIKVALSEL
jgi:hypothetical protein